MADVAGRPETRKTTTSYPVPFRNPLKCTPFLILLIIVILIIIWIYASGKVPGFAKLSLSVSLIISLFFIALSIYLLCSMGHNGWAWIILVLLLVFFFLAIAGFKSFTNSLPGNIQSNLQNLFPALQSSNLR